MTASESSMFADLESSESALAIHEKNSTRNSCEMLLRQYLKNPRTKTTSYAYDKHSMDGRRDAVKRHQLSRPAITTDETWRALVGDELLGFLSGTTSRTRFRRLNDYNRIVFTALAALPLLRTDKDFICLTINPQAGENVACTLRDLGKSIRAVDPDFKLRYFGASVSSRRLHQHTHVIVLGIPPATDRYQVIAAYCKKRGNREVSFRRGYDFVGAVGYLLKNVAQTKIHAGSVKLRASQGLRRLGHVTGRSKADDRSICPAIPILPAAAAIPMGTDALFFVRDTPLLRREANRLIAEGGTPECAVREVLNRWRHLRCLDQQFFA